MTENQKSLRVNLQMLYHWSRFPGERCGLCGKPVDYGAQVESYLPRFERGSYQTEAEDFQASDDYCNAVADQQERGHFTIYAMRMMCGECASQAIIEDVGALAVPILATARMRQQERLWVATLLLYEPGAYGKYQPFLIHSAIPTSLEKIYAYARRGHLSDEPRFEAYRYPIDEA